MKALALALFSITLAAHAADDSGKKPKLLSCETKIASSSFLLVKSFDPAAIKNHINDFLADVSIAFAAKLDPANMAPNLHETTRDFLLRVEAGQVRPRLNRDQEIPFHLVTEFHLEGKKGVIKTDELVVSESAFEQMLTYHRQSPIALVRNYLDLDPKLVEAWFTTFSEGHYIELYNQGKVGMERLNAWDYAITAATWRKNYAAGENFETDIQFQQRNDDVASRLWKLTSSLHAEENIGAIINAFGLEHLTDLSAITDGKSPKETYAILNEFVRRQAASDSTPDTRARWEAFLGDGYFRPAFLHLGAKAADFFVAQQLAAVGGFKTPEMKALIEFSRLQYEQAFLRLERWLDPQKHSEILPVTHWN